MKTMKKNNQFLLLLSIILIGILISSELFGTQRVKVRIPIHFAKVAELHRVGFIRDHKRDSRFVYGYLEQNKLSRLTRKTHNSIEVLGLDLPVPRALYEGYHDYDDLTLELKTLAEKYPNLVHLDTAGKSVQGRELWYLILSDNPSEDEPEPKITYIANMHGDETVGRELMIYLIRLLLSEYGTNPEITNLLDNSQLFIMPSMNPDGFEMGRRWNANGTDLNRNFPDEVNDPNNTPEGREIETQHIMTLAEKHHFVTGLNWHGGAVCMNLPWDIRPNNDPDKKFGDDPFIYMVSREYADLNRPMYNNDYSNFDHGVTYGYEWYPIYGGMQDYFNAYAQSIHATGELSNTKWPSSSSLAGHWDDNREAMLNFFFRSIEGFHLYVTDGSGKGVNNISITVSSAPRRTLTYKGPYIHRPAIPGQQSVTIHAEGFEPITLIMDSETFTGTHRTVALWKK